MLSTPDKSPWADRNHPVIGDDPRESFPRDRDRIVHCASFRKLQHKTQVLVVNEGDYFRTRITHTLEVTQIGRTISRWLGLTEPLVEAICLSHDLGHGPFGHSGERALQQLLAKYDLEWNSNTHSLTVVEEMEVQYCDVRGLNLTWATREGLARHCTKYDEPVSTGEYGKYRQPSMEAQIASVADVIAYGTHDVEDAIWAGLLSVEQLHELNIDIWKNSWQQANDEFSKSHPEGIWPGVNLEQLRITRARRHLIDQLIRDVHDETINRVQQNHLTSLIEVREFDKPVVDFSQHVQVQVNHLLDLMMTIYKGPVVSRQNHRATHILSQLFEALVNEHSLLPPWVRERIEKKSSLPALEIARFLAELTDKGAVDLYSELFEPTERAMGHRVM